MRNGDLEEIRLEVRQKLEVGKQKGETEAETISQIVWKEREKHRVLLSALEEISRVASIALDHHKESFNKTADVLEWRKPLH